MQMWDVLSPILPQLYLLYFSHSWCVEFFLGIGLEKYFSVWCFFIEVK
jgi:hypothetical protein